MQAAELAGDIGVEKLHELRQLFLGLGKEEEMVVIRQEGDGTDLHGRTALCPAKSALDRGVDPG